jgi:hypothetical protein
VVTSHWMVLGPVQTDCANWIVSEGSKKKQDERNREREALVFYRYSTYPPSNPDQVSLKGL